MPAAQVADISTMVDPLAEAVEIISDRLYYVALKSHPSKWKSQRVSHICGKPVDRPIHFFSIDNDLVYWNFFLDFGPLNLGQLYRFATILNHKLKDPNLTHKNICFFSNTSSNKRANAIYLICAWKVLYLNQTPNEAFLPFRRNTASVLPPLPPFHDASPCQCTFDLTILDCLNGLSKARMYRFFDYDDFDVDEYEYFEQVENGDLNWIVKDKILAFAGPHNRREMSREGYCTLTPDDYIPHFLKNNIQLVVRLNKKCYDERKFTDVGMTFSEHYYLDGSVPPMKILHKVLQAFEAVPKDKGFAVHCKAGLGRTGTCIGAYMMKHYKFTASEAIGWMRICRPGCVIGPQQHFLQEIEQQMWHEGDIMRLEVPKSLKISHEKEVKKKKDKGLLKNAKALGISKLQFGSLTVNDAKGEKDDKEKQGEALLARRVQHSPHCISPTKD